MPRKSTVSKSTATAPKAPRKTRTRKTATVKTVTSKTVKPAPVAKPVAKKVTVTTFQGGKVIAKKTTLKRPGTSKLITPQRYMADIATRWAIHNYEIQELLKDFSKGFEIVKPYHAQVVKMLNNWALGVNPLFFLPVLVLPFKCRSHKQLGFIGISGFDSRYRQTPNLRLFSNGNWLHCCARPCWILPRLPKRWRDSRHYRRSIRDGRGQLNNCHKTPLLGVFFYAIM